MSVEEPWKCVCACMHLFFYIPCTRTCTCRGLWCVGCVHACVRVFLARPSASRQNEAKPWISSTFLNSDFQEEHLSPSDSINHDVQSNFSPILKTSEVAPQFTDRRMAIAASSAGQRLVTDRRCVTLTLGSVLPCSSSSVCVASESSHIRDLFFATSAMSGGRDCSVCAETRSTCQLKGCVCVCFLWFWCLFKEGWLYACILWSHPGVAGVQRIICL